MSEHELLMREICDYYPMLFQLISAEVSRTHSGELGQVPQSRMDYIMKQWRTERLVELRKLSLSGCMMLSCVDRVDQVLIRLDKQWRKQRRKFKEQIESHAQKLKETHALLEKLARAKQHMQEMKENYEEALARELWYYQDPSGQEQGPFDTVTMQNWFADGYFPPDLPIRSSDSSFDELADWFRRGSPAFLTKIPKV